MSGFISAGIWAGAMTPATSGGRQENSNIGRNCDQNCGTALDICTYFLLSLLALAPKSAAT